MFAVKPAAAERPRPEGACKRALALSAPSPMFARPLQRWARSVATAATEYPFSKAVQTITPPPKLPAPLLQGKGLMQHLAETLPTPDKQRLFATYFSKDSKERIFPGTVLSVALNHAPHTFTGVVTNIRRRGMDTSFVLRNIISRTGVEMQFFVNSPHLKKIQIVQRPKGRGMRRAKLFYLRDSPEKMTAISSQVRS